jgi:hypothetical protein
VKYASNGEVSDIVINESKFGTSRLSTTKDGYKQMSPDWIEMNIKKWQGQQIQRLGQLVSC